MRYVLLAFLLVGCNAPTDAPSGTAKSPSLCRGAYSTRDAQGNLRKFNEYSINGQCFTDNVALTRWEATSESRRKAGVSCVPQAFTSRTLVSANNFYAYRDGKVYLDLNASTGEYRKLTFAEGKDGKQVFSRLQGCFYVRHDATYGDQILLDVLNMATSQQFDPMEIFTYTTTATTMEMSRFDSSGDWDYRFCPADSTPWGYCDLLRNGNEMYFPNLSPAQQASVLAEALLIRKQFNYSTVSTSVFNNLWSKPEQTRTEEPQENYKYVVASIVDTPSYIDQAWASFVRGTRPTMPDVTSSQMPYICYDAHRTVTLIDGSTSRINGEVCYVDGQYVFTQ